MRLLVVAIIWFLLVGCGVDLSERHSAPHRGQYVVTGFEEYLETFEIQAIQHQQPIRVNDLVIDFQGLNLEARSDGNVTLGICYLQDNTTPTIHIDPYYWKDMTESMRQRLISHEMGHCILHREHMSEHLSIMRPMMLSDEEFDAQPVYLLDELYNKQYYGTFNLVDDPDRVWVN